MLIFRPIGGLGTVIDEPAVVLGQIPRDLFAVIDPERWQQLGEDPVALLGAVGPGRLDELRPAGDDEFLARLDELGADLRDYLTRPLWYQQQDPAGMPAGIAYFSMEFGVAEVLPNYSGDWGSWRATI